MNAEDLAAILDELGRRLGPAGEYVFRLAVQRVVIESVITLSLGVIALIVAVGGLLLARNGVAESHANGKTAWQPATDDEPGQLKMLVGWSMFGIATGIAFALIVVTGSLMRLLTPEYTALRDILAAVGGAR